ncbi:preprotein translocase subunit SecE [Candidatus Woesebacteria bacterium]|nr:preprotein translocase subunit SecE [Candidatus Woesebacteria bacterium]|tara:strand:- start:1227 stop:1406 length:180 start_codon:yes stop_codon:yes gene_type:complete
MNPVSFLREVKAELDKVVWPTREKTIQLTVLVIVASIFIGVYIGGLDYIFASIMSNFIR